MRLMFERGVGTRGRDGRTLRLNFMEMWPAPRLMRSLGTNAGLTCFAPWLVLSNSDTTMGRGRKVTELWKATAVCMIVPKLPIPDPRQTPCRPCEYDQMGTYTCVSTTGGGLTVVSCCSFVSGCHPASSRAWPAAKMAYCINLVVRRSSLETFSVWLYFCMQRSISYISGQPICCRPTAVGGASLPDQACYLTL